MFIELLYLAPFACCEPPRVVGVIACCIAAVAEAPRVSGHWTVCLAQLVQKECPHSLTPTEWNRARQLITLLVKSSASLTDDRLAETIVTLQGTFDVDKHESW